MNTMKKIFHSIDQNIKNKVDNTYLYPNEWSEMKKKRVQNQYISLKRKIDDITFYIRQNEYIYVNNMKEDKTRFEEENVTKEERKRMNDEILYNKKRQEDLDKKKKVEEEIELEKRAQMEMRIANELHETMKISKKQEGQKKKKSRHNKNDMMEDNEGNMPLQNFANGNNDLEEETFQDLHFIQDNRNTKKKDSTTGNNKNEKKRLKKKITTVDREEDSDEMLDIVPIDDNEDTDNRMEEGNAVIFDGGDDNENVF